MTIFDELNRRRVYRVAAAYLVVGWLLTEVLTTLLPEIGAAEWVSRAVIYVFALGLIPAVGFSWTYDITPDGIRKERREAGKEEATQVPVSTGDRLAIAATFLVVLGLGTFGAWWTSTPSERVAADISDTSVAVLPFENMSADADNAYFSDGLTETILHMLTQLPELQVAARTSSFSFRDRDMTIREIAQALGVAHILEGSVQRAGDQIRVTAQLIRAEDGFHIWSRNYDLTIDDIFAVQDQIASDVGGELSATLLRGNGSMLETSTTNSDAYDLYLQALGSRTTFSYGSLREAEILLKAALTIDPDYLDAKVELAINYWRQLETGSMEQQVAMDEIDAITAQVLRIRPDDATALAIAIFSDTFRRSQSEGTSVFEAAVARLEALVRENPSELVPKIVLTRLYQSRQELDKAVEVLSEALERDPYNAAIHFELGAVYAGLQRWDEARAAMARSLEIEPEQPNAYTIIGAVGLNQGDGVEYLEQFMRAIELDPLDHELPGLIAILLYELGLVEEADDFHDRVIAIAPNSEIAYRLELLRAIVTDDVEAGEASARRAIADDVGDRRQAFSGAVHHLLRLAIQQGRVEDELAWLEEQVPGLLDVTADNVPIKYRNAQGAAFDAWFVALPRGEFLERLDQILGILADDGFDMMSNPRTAVAVYAFREDFERAADTALEGYFSQSFTVNLDWRRTLAQAQFAPLLEDERVGDAIARWEQEEAELRDQIRNWLSELSTNGMTAET